VKVRLLFLILVLPMLGGLFGWWRYQQWREHRFDAVIREAARRYGVEPALIKAVIWCESRFTPGARGRAGELGLMQIRAPAAGEWAAAERVSPFSHEHLADPSTNTLAGTWYLARLLKRYRQTENPVAYALADYNAGRSNVLRWNKGAAETNTSAFLARMDFPGTRRYVKDVSLRREKYRREQGTRE